MLLELISSVLLYFLLLWLLENFNYAGGSQYIYVVQCCSIMSVQNNSETKGQMFSIACSDHASCVLLICLRGRINSCTPTYTQGMFLKNNIP